MSKQRKVQRIKAGYLPGLGDEDWPLVRRLAVEVHGRDRAEKLAAGLRDRGHEVKVVGDLDGACSVEAIRVLGNGVRMAASDPRRDGWAAAY